MSLVLALASTSVITRYLGAEGFGQYATVLALTTLISGVTDFGLANVGVAHWLDRDRKGRQELLANLLTARLFIATLAGIAALAYVAIAGYSEVVFSGTAVALAAVAINACASVLAVPLMVSLRWATIGAIEVCSTMIQVAIQVPLALGGLGVITLSAALVPSALAGLALTAMLVRGDLVAPSRSFTGAGRILRESVVFGVASAASVVYLRSTMLVVPLVVSAASVGHFAIGFRAVESLTVVPLLLTGALFPVLVHASHREPARFAAGFDTLWRASSVVGAAMGACVIGLAPLAVLAISGTRNSISEDALAVLAIGLSTLFMSASSMWMLLAQRSYPQILRINAVALPLNVAITLVATKTMGVEWAGLGLVGCEIFIAGAASRAVWARLDVQQPRHAWHALKIFASLSAAGACYVVLRDSGIAWRTVAPPVACVLTLMITRAVPAELHRLVSVSGTRLRQRRSRPGR